VPALLVIGAVAVFLVTRFAFLDADVPDWRLTEYSPIDEFAYAIPAFDLNLYGSWVHQAAPWAPIEGLPMNAAQNLVAAATIGLVGHDFFGLRASSVVFGLVTFLGLIAVVRQQAEAARRLDGIAATLATAVTVGAGVLLLADFSSLLSGRIVEPTITRLAATTLVLFLVGRGTFLGPSHSVARSAAFGAVVAGAVLFVYIYNLFLVPAALITLAWWAHRSGSWPLVVRHGAAFLAGALAVAVVYFALVYAIYGQTPTEWYRVWLGSFANSNRATGVSIDKALSILGANVFRLDPVFLGLFLASLPVFVWNLRRRATPSGVLIGIGLAFFVLQAAFVADYPTRKFVAVMLFAVPIVASGVLHFGAFRAWVVERPERVIAAGLWLAATIAVTVFEYRLHPVPPNTARLGMFVVASGLLGAAAMVVLAVSRRPVAIRIGAVALGLAVLAPLLYADWAFVYRQPTFTYRDAMIEVRDVVDGQVTAGGWSFGMQLYNASRPVLSGYFLGQTRSEYERNVVRMFADGLATSMFDYVDPETRGAWEALGFRVVDTYRIILPRGQQLGRYEFGADR
jgi:hypothetical protein